MTDWQLLRKFTEGNSQAAFAELSQRYTNLVYRVCQRELGDTSLAEDAAQAVFLLLARKAPSLHPSRQEATLSSWLFQTALLTAKNARRQERRRAAKELEAAQMPPPAASPEWIEIEPLLNDALEALPPGQRSLLIERFFYDRPLAEIGAGQGISEDAARMRVNRALDRLRRFFAARNVALSAAALAAVLPSAVHPAPVHAAEAIARLTLPTANDNTPAQTLAQGIIDTMNLRRLKIQLGAAALVAVFVLGTAGAVRVTAQMKARRVAAAEQENQAQALTVLNQMYATYAAMHSFKCSVTSREEPLHTAQDADYEIEYPNKIRFKRFTLLGGDMSGQATAVSDGNNLYVTCTEAGGNPNADGTILNGLADRYAKLPVSNWLANFGGLPMWGTEPNAGMPFVALGKRLEDDHSSQMSAPTFALGQPVVLDLPGVPGPMPFDVVIAHVAYQAGAPGRDWKGAEETVTYYIGQRDHLLYKLVATDPLSPTDLDIRTELINSNEVNPKLPASDFAFTPPPGSHEVRDTVDLFPGSRGH
jgi:RNA polymerase sigma factor (sigma-70 family)